MIVDEGAENHIAPSESRASNFGRPKTRLLVPKSTQKSGGR
jgi:hypothetical protein